MNTVIVKSGQTFADIAVQEYGSFEAAVLLAVANDMSVTDSLAGATELKLIDQTFDKVICDYCKTNGVSPTSGTFKRTRIFTEQFAPQFN